MRKQRRIKSFRSIVVVFVVLFFILSLAPVTVNRLRGITVDLFSPFWNTFSSAPDTRDEEIQKLQLHNALLQMQK